MLVPRAVLLLAFPLMAACAAVTTADGRRFGVASSEFRSYIEGVFRDQNKTASDLAFAVEDSARPGGAEPLELGAAEDALLAACAGLNELATSSLEERHVPLRRRVALARETPQCERATLAARTALATPAR